MQQFCFDALLFGFDLFTWELRKHLQALLDKHRLRCSEMCHQIQSKEADSRARLWSCRANLKPVIVYPQTKRLARWCLASSGNKASWKSSIHYHACSPFINLMSTSSVPPASRAADSATHLPPFTSASMLFWPSPFQKIIFTSITGMWGAFSSGYHNHLGQTSREPSDFSINELFLTRQTRQRLFRRRPGDML